MGGLDRVLVAMALSLALLHSPEAARRRRSPSPNEPVAEAVGRGTLEQLVCLGCGATIVAAGGLTLGGLLVVSFFHADAVVSCAYFCYTGFIAA